MGVKEEINAKIQSKKVMVIAKSWCGFSKTAKEVFEKCIKSGKLDANDYDFWDIDFESNGDAIQDELKKMTGARTVPRVFIKGKFFGGGDEVKAAADNKTLIDFIK